MELAALRTCVRFYLHLKNMFTPQNVLNSFCTPSKIFTQISLFGENT